MNREMVDEIFQRVVEERARQDLIWGQQDWPMINDFDIRLAKTEELFWKHRCDQMAVAKNLDWRTILMEESCEAFSEEDPGKQVQELVQVAAVVFAMIECIQRNRK